MALLCLTSFHDIMKVKSLLPTVQAEHAPYLGYQAGEEITDHDIALSYVLTHYPQLLPSFGCLPKDQRAAVLFTQGKMQFNHGWFVQAEAPPGHMLAHFKSILQAGGAKEVHVALYFIHWLTDLAGAQGTPLCGMEKFVLKFPHAVLKSFLWSMPFINALATKTESEVVEDYLIKRWEAASPTRTLPSHTAMIAKLRLACMLQSNVMVVVKTSLNTLN